MSTEHTCRDQRARLDGLGYRTSMLDTVRDVDTFSDALEVARSIPGTRFAAAVRAVEKVGLATG